MEDVYNKSIEVFDLRLKSLAEHYERLQEETRKLSRDLESFTKERTQGEEEMKRRIQELNDKYSAKSAELTSQYEMLDQMYNKKEDELKMLQNYVELDHRQRNDLECSTREGSMRLKWSAPKWRVLTEKFNYMEKLSRELFQEYCQVMSLLKLSRDAVQQGTGYKEGCEKLKLLQETTIERLQRETNQLNLVISQNPVGETTGDLIPFASVRSIKSSLLNTSDYNTTLTKLRKHKDKQRKIIKLLTHKRIIISRQNDLLTVEKQKIQDQTLYYTDIISKANEGQYSNVELFDD